MVPANNPRLVVLVTVLAIFFQVTRVGRAAVFANQPYVFRPDEKGERALGRGQIGARRRVHRLEELLAPPKLDPVGAGLEHGAAQHIADADDARHAL